MQKSGSSDGPACGGFIVEIGGRFDSEYRSITAALKAGLEIKHKNAQADVHVYEAHERVAK